MSIGSLGFIGAVAGSPLAQVKGDADRAKATADAHRLPVLDRKQERNPLLVHDRVLRSLARPEQLAAFGV